MEPRAIGLMTGVATFGLAVVFRLWAGHADAEGPEIPSAAVQTRSVSGSSTCAPEAGAALAEGVTPVLIQIEIREGDLLTCRSGIPTIVKNKAKLDVGEPGGKGRILECTVTALDGDYCDVEIAVKDGTEKDPWAFEARTSLRFGKTSTFSVEGADRKPRQMTICVEKTKPQGSGK